MYAPIVIPTLNRAEKLRDCLESLAICTGASETEVYISVDYPPSEHYVEGYNIICREVDDWCRGFKNKHIFFQTCNLGAKRNLRFVIDQVRGDSEAFIFSEDDNIFSPNFLEFINQGLERFNDDDRIMAIVGNEGPYPNLDLICGNICLHKHFNPWGFGMWLSDWDLLCEKTTISEFKKAFRDRIIVKRMYTERADLFRMMTEAVINDPTDKSSVYNSYYLDGDLDYIDHTLSVSMYINNWWYVSPIKSMVRNTGVEDGSGVHDCTWTDFEYSKQEIDEEKEFAFDVDVERFNSIIYKSNCSKKRVSYRPAIRARILRRVYIVCGSKFTRLLMRIAYSVSKKLA